MSDQDPALKGKVCLITGGTSGIGAVTAEELAKQGARVVVVGRSRGRCEATVARIQERNGPDSADWIAADLSAQSEVRCLADEYQRRYERLDVLVNNAGALFMERRESVDGIEMTFALNHLGYFLLTNLLIEQLRASAPARVVVVASDAHRGVKLNLDDLQNTRAYRGFRAYCQSKLANVLFAYELARRLEGTGVTVNALHPGFVATNFLAGQGAGYWVARRVANLIAIRPEQGARTSIHLASSPEVDGVTGQYFARARAIPSSRTTRDVETARRLWQLSEQMTGLADSTPNPS